MAGQSGSQAGGLEARLAADPFGFDFFHAVRWIERARCNEPTIGKCRPPRDDPIRFSQEPSLAFPPSTVSGYTRGGGAVPSRMAVRFLGLLGPNGPLPLRLTSFARDRMLHHGDSTLARFLDIFNNRMISLFYRAWAAAQLTVSHDWPEEDRFAGYFCSLFGIGMSALRQRDSVPDVAKIHYAGHLVCRTRHAAGLRAMLEDYFGVPASIRPFVGHWMHLPADSLCRLGESPASGTLGKTAIVGARIWECQQRFRIRLGPMGFVDYVRLLPDGDSLRRLAAWVRLYAGDELSWEVQLVLKAAEVPKIELGRQGRLGRTTWLWSVPFKRDADDLVLAPAAA